MKYMLLLIIVLIILRKKRLERLVLKLLFVQRKLNLKEKFLSLLFNKLKKEKDIDAYVIFDADNLVHRDFLSKMNDSLNMGYSVVQGFRDTKNVSDNWLSCSYAIMYYIQNLFLNKSRYNLGKSSLLMVLVLL